MPGEAGPRVQGDAGLWVLSLLPCLAIFSWGFSAEKPVQLPSCAGAWLDLSRAGAWMDFVPRCAAPPALPYPCACGCSLLRAVGRGVWGALGFSHPTEAMLLGAALCLCVLEGLGSRPDMGRGECPLVPPILGAAWGARCLQEFLCEYGSCPISCCASVSPSCTLAGTQGHCCGGGQWGRGWSCSPDQR